MSFESTRLGLRGSSGPVVSKANTPASAAGPAYFPRCNKPADGETPRMPGDFKVDLGIRMAGGIKKPRPYPWSAEVPSREDAQNELQAFNPSKARTLAASSSAFVTPRTTSPSCPRPSTTRQQTLILVAEHGGPTMAARIAMIRRALSYCCNAQDRDARISTCNQSFRKKPWVNSPE
jgi:hypothetical protein